ncbi:MAG TPA: CHAT domain-containing protein [Nocardioides sp.]|nr:CHAT domain-containing protein [Nocardioides sp.]
MRTQAELAGLLDLAMEHPDRAEAEARDVLGSTPEPLAETYARHGLGIVLRDRGDLRAAAEQLRLAIRAASHAGLGDRERDIRATLGVTLVLDGRPRAGLRELDRAVGPATAEPDELTSKILMRKAAIVAELGRPEDAAGLIRAALAGLVASGSLLWEARTRVWLAVVEERLGRLAVAEREAGRARELFARLGSPEVLSAVEQLALIAVARGDLPTGLALHGEVRAGHERLGEVPQFSSLAFHAEACLAASMPQDAMDLLSDPRVVDSLPAHERADLHLLLADTALAGVRHSDALEQAGRAARLYRAQGRTALETRARLVAARARAAAGRNRGLAASVKAVATAMDDARDREAPLALTLAGQLSRGDERVTFWSRAASYRRHPNALVRAAAWHAQSLARQEQDDRGGVLRAAAAGLDAVDEHRRLIGSSELRALATTHGRELTAIALRHAATDPRTLLRWSERTRATALAQPPATSDAATIPASLAALRDNGRRLAEARQEGEPTDALERERLRLERAVRAESHTLSATTADQQRPPSVEEVVAAVGDGCLAELVDVDGTLHVLVVHAGTVRRRVAGSTEEVAELLGPTQMLLRRASRGRPADMTALGRQLQDAILGDAARLVPDGPLVLVPTARLHGLPWALLPTLADRPFSVVPSAGQWLRATATPRPVRRNRRTLLVCGPGLATGGAEVPLLAASHPDATLLAGREATLDRVTRQLDGADLVHLAAHGHFRADSPLFSALDLADGPLTVHDLERVRRAPYRVVLSACESGVLAPVGAEELLGLAAALFSLGTAGLVSSVAEVNDTATADLMVDLHAALADGADPATALHRVRCTFSGDPVAAGTAAAFLALGV